MRARRPGRRRGPASITATTDERVFIRGTALDEAIGSVSFPSMLLLLWRGDTPSGVEADLMGACLVAAIDQGPCHPPPSLRGRSRRRGRPR